MLLATRAMSINLEISLQFCFARYSDVHWEKIMFTCEKFWGDMSVAAEAPEYCMLQIQFLLVNFIGRLIQIKIHSASLCKRQVCTAVAIIQNGSCWCFWSRNVYNEPSASGAHLDIIRRLREGGVPMATIVWTYFVLKLYERSRS